ncbi:fructosamine kinase family protein [Paludifilum halophilum]|uniref:Fructosamine kinase n=1 Tax=Paludifilum halophilum TaxID=1642702 RepID=A0A235BCZ5_9BACL|nr:fructosamine kinase family protein [Paludifilum halophilum]OYD09929.1 hypothetical protein CHM34_02850 [Paludifilum halophilum]
MLTENLRQSLEAVLQEKQRDFSPLMQAQPVSGGDISEAYRLETKENRYFLKMRKDAPAGFFSAEREGLSQLNVTPLIRIPEVIGHSDGNGTGWILLEWLDTRPGGESADPAHQLGQGLAKIHRESASSFGLESDNFIGLLTQANRPMKRWADFYRERRLQPQVECASRLKRLPASRARGLERLMERLDRWIGDPTIRPGLLHGDLWGGNWMTGTDGRPCLIDPAIYYGHREVDLAFSELFGGFPTAFYDAYQEAYPLEPGYEERKPLYQLYYLLVHLNLFGEAYGPAVDRVWKRYAG